MSINRDAMNKPYYDDIWLGNSHLRMLIRIILWD